MANEKYEVGRANLHNVREQITRYFGDVDDRLDTIEDYIGSAPPGGVVIDYLWSTLLAGDPTSGHVATNTADVYTVTEIRVSKTTANGNDATVFLQALKPGDIFMLFEQVAPNNTSIFQIDTIGVDLTTYYQFAVTPSTIPGQVLPALQDNPLQVYFIGNPNRYLPEGGNTGDILDKVSDDDYDVQWVDGLTKFFAANGDHNDLSNVLPNQHHPHIHKLYGEDIALANQHSDVDITDPLETRHLLAWNGAIFNAEFRMNWRGNWGQQTYEKYDTVLDFPWLMTAINVTTDRAAPQPLGDPAWTVLDDPPAWQTFDYDGVVYSGHKYTFNELGYFRSLRIWVPELTGMTNYRVIIVRNPNSANPNISSIEEPVLNLNDWTILGVGTELVVPGEELIIFIDALNTSDEVTWAYNWLYRGTSNTLPPLSGGWNTNVTNDLMRIDYLDAETPPIGHSLELDVVVGTVFEISEVGSPTNFRKYTVDAVPVDQGTYYEYTVTMVDSGGTLVNGVATQVRAVQPIANPTKFVGIPAYWNVGNQPVWGTVESFLEFDDVPQAVDPNNLYGIDVSFQRLTVSPDWDFVALSGGSGGGGSGGGAFPEPPDDGTTYGRITEDWRPVYTQNEANLIFIPEAPGDPAIQPYVRRGDLQEWERGIGYDEFRSYIDWDIVNGNYTAAWGDRILVEAAPNQIDLPEPAAADPVDDLVIWNNGSQLTHVTTVVPFPGCAFVYDHDTTPIDESFELNSGEMVRLTSRTATLYNVAIDAAAPFNGEGSPGHVPDPAKQYGAGNVDTGAYLSAGGLWQSIVAPPSGGAVQLEYVFSTQTVGVPAQGIVYVNNVVPASATVLTINMTTQNGNRFQQLWQSFQKDDVIWIVDQGGGNTYGYVITDGASPFDGGGSQPDWNLATYVTFPLGTNAIDGSIPDVTGVLVQFLSNPAARIPPGGTIGQHLAKQSNTDFDTYWADAIDEAPNDAWSYTRQWTGAQMQWNAGGIAPVEFEGILGVNMRADKLGVYDAETKLSVNSIEGIFTYNNTPASAPQVHFLRSRGTNAAPASVQDGDSLMWIVASGYRPGQGGDGFTGDAGGIGITVDAGVAGNSVPGRLIFHTTGVGDTYSTERMRITSEGYVGIGFNDPQNPLHVIGYDGAVPGITRPYSGTTAIFESNGFNDIRLLQADDFNTYGGITWGFGANPVSRGIYMYGQSGQYRPLALEHWANGHYFVNSAYVDILSMLESGNVGIGTATPSEKLQINNSVAGNTYAKWTNTSTPVGLDVGLTGSGEGIVWHRDALPIRFGTSNAEQARIDPAGNVGIGTAFPSGQSVNKLTVVGNAVSSSTSGNATGKGDILIQSSQTTLAGDSGLEFKVAGGAGGYGSKIQALNASGSALAFAGRQNTGVWSEYMRITPTGDVGIGTTAPLAKLHVKGNIRAYGAQTAGGSLTTSGGGQMIINTNSDQSERGVIQFNTAFGDRSGSTPRRTADILAGYDGGVWGTEYLSLNVGSSNDQFILTTERARLTANALDLKNGATYHQDGQPLISEGTFTPTLLNVTHSITHAYGYYQKVGKMVTAIVRIQWFSLNTADSSDFRIGNLPFTCNEGAAECPGGGPITRIQSVDFGGVSNKDIHIAMYTVNGQNYMNMAGNVSLGESGPGALTMTYQQCSASGNIECMATYRTDG